MANVSTSSAAAAPEPHGRVTAWWNGPRDFLASLNDPAIIFGVKFGLAGVLSIFVALLIRLPEPTWALFTVFVLMIAQYVGAIAEKSFFRVVGTVIGGLLGYILNASLEQQPWVFLPAVGLIVGFCTAMFGQSQYPYAFLLCGLTTVVVVSNGLGNPDESWKYMLWRVEEVTVGVLVTVIVQCIFWPRYARKEFNENVRGAFRDLKACFTESSRIFLEGGNPEATKRAEEFPARISGLRGLLDFGARESHFFRERLPTYFEITTCLSRIAAAIVTMGDELPTNSLYRPAVAEDTRKLHAAIEAALEDLSHEHSSKESRQKTREAFEAAFNSLEQRLKDLRENPEIYSIPVGDVLSLGIHGLALDEIRLEIRRLHVLLDSLPEDMTVHTKDIEPFVSPVPPLFWIRSGIKSGIAVIVALFLYDWLNPPGGTMMVLGAWVFTALTATSPGGRGDRRAFHYVIYNTVVMFALCLVLLLTTPVMASYAVMNVVIFTWLFVWGYLSYTTRGVTIPMQMGMLQAVSILGLNAQKPVQFQAIADVFFGIVTATILAAMIQRLIWPSLPQWELRDRFVLYLRLCRQIVDEGVQSLPLWKKARLALIPGEASQRINVLFAPICPPGEKESLRLYLHTLQRLGSHLVATMGRLKEMLPEERKEESRHLIAEMEGVLRQHLIAHEKGFKQSTPLPLETTKLEAQLDAWAQWIHDLRAWSLKTDYPVIETLRLMGVAARYELAGRELVTAAKQMNALRLPLYMGDYVL